MRQVFYPASFTPHVRDLDVAGTIEDMQGRITTNADTISSADNDRLMVGTDKKLAIKILDKLHTLSIEDNEIKFKEI